MISRAGTEPLIAKKCREREISLDRTKFRTPHEHKLLRSSIDDDNNNNNNNNNKNKVSVVYYLSRNGHLEHPHFIEVPLSSSQGLYLRDVMNTLNSLRGRGMAKMYSWSSKWSYRNGFVWHDLSDDDLIHPTHTGEYVLKGSELIRTSVSFRYYNETNGSSETLLATNMFSSDGCGFPATNPRRDRSLCSFDGSDEYRRYKSELLGGEPAGEIANASTQTGQERRTGGGEESEVCVSWNSGSKVLEGVSESRTVDRSADIRDRTVENERPSGRMKASRVLRQWVACGSVSVKGSEPII